MALRASFCSLSLVPIDFRFGVYISNSGTGCCQNLSGEQLGRSAMVLVDRKRWTGGRSRTLAPPRGAAWMSRLLLTPHDGVEWEMNQMLGTQKTRQQCFNLNDVPLIWRPIRGQC
jgi:hypothetical protein